jgi:NADPH:quinone reductase-like Zn-dependent oxidoreductase
VRAPGDLEAARPFDVVLELVGAPSFPGSLDRLAPGGRICVIGVGGGGRVELELFKLMARRGRILASTLRSRTLAEKAAAVAAVERHVLPLLAAGRIRVPVEATYPLEEAAAAYERFVAGRKLGKIVLVT